ncbi:MULTISPECIES: ABC transporter permease [Sporosarcina]|uniref:ABC transporter permease n=1 Tax=Sporosarcina TaxID=1569 RepID=UPI00129A82C8|nr:MULTISPECIES: FtsX-like permease family protein [Sporosarcina]GKV64453.1 ABC transporter permease YtrF [Sporosarcina sp. NCCP-2331]GLB55198.1 ABC transporter permease YtrF [Sporosarcina sp. NCCP-2378]
MQFKDQIDFIRQHIRKNKLRVFMTVLAATMGTAFLIVLASVGFGIHDTLRNEILDNRLVTQIEVYSSELDVSKAVEMKDIDHVKAVVVRQNVNALQQESIGKYTANGNLLVTDFNEEAKVGFALEEGRLPETADEVVVGSGFAESLIDQQAADKIMESLPADSQEEPDLPAYDGKLIGEKFVYQMGDYNTGDLFKDQTELTIVGIAEKPSKDWLVDNKIYADAELIPKLENIYQKQEADLEDNPLLSSMLYVYADELENVKSVTNQLKEDGYDVYSISEELDRVDVFFLALKAGLVFVGTIAILISSIGIFNTMTMAVTERTREIGVMKAIGAQPKLIQRLFLMESAWIGIVGTVLALIISYAVSFVSNWLLPIIVGAAMGEEDFADLHVTFSIIPWQLVVIASAISLTVAVVSGWRPARKATKIDVIDALRREL